MIRRLALAALAFATFVAPLSGQDRPLVVIDPGHGGAEAGVVAEGIVEKDLILELSFVIGAEFVKAGYDVHFTRTRDVPVEWADRRAQAEGAGAAALFMLHAMQSEDPGASGSEVYWDESEASSSALSRAVTEALRGLGLLVTPEPRPWPFLQSRAVPTTMIELVHLTHAAERILIRDPVFQHRLGRALVEAFEVSRR
jgi:N-acetylmuramoyl-L-alanine amidase